MCIRRHVSRHSQQALCSTNVRCAGRIRCGGDDEYGYGAFAFHSVPFDE